jgi:hypothetical protein
LRWGAACKRVVPVPLAARRQAGQCRRRDWQLPGRGSTAGAHLRSFWCDRRAGNHLLTSSAPGGGHARCSAAWSFAAVGGDSARSPPRAVAACCWPRLRKKARISASDLEKACQGFPLVIVQPRVNSLRLLVARVKSGCAMTPGHLQGQLTRGNSLQTRRPPFQQPRLLHLIQHHPLKVIVFPEHLRSCIHVQEPA